VATLEDQRLYAALMEARAQPAAQDDEVAALVGAVVESGRAAYPDIALDAVDFARHLGRHLPEGDVVAGLAALRAADLYVACACATGAPSALAAFETHFGGELRIVRARLRRPDAEAEDFIQGCRQRLFAPPAPKIAEYSGHGDLRHWLRVTLVRLLIDYQRKHKQRDAHEQLGEPGTPGMPRAVPAPTGDVELDYLKRHYGDAFRTAFEAAAAELEPADRNLLRQHFADGLGIDELAALHGVHRATAARRIARARTELLSLTRQHLMRALGLDKTELDSVMRMIESNVHVSVQRILGHQH
jgi:RNA polymerase sigma-70 factor, ECF subfamily